MFTKILLCLLLFSFGLSAHEGHSHEEPYGYLWWLGNFHPLILQFPIVLTVMTGVTECLCYLRQNPFYAHAARFLLLAAAVLVIPTVLLGLALGYRSEPDYNEFLIGYYIWHRFFGIVTGLLIIGTAYVREYVRIGALYYALLALSVCSVIVTAYLGGSMTFGPYALVPPVFN